MLLSGLVAKRSIAVPAAGLVGQRRDRAAEERQRVGLEDDERLLAARGPRRPARIQARYCAAVVSGLPEEYWPQSRPGMP